MRIIKKFTLLLASSAGAMFFAQSNVNSSDVDSLRSVLGSKLAQFKPIDKSKLKHGEVPPNEYYLEDYKRTLNLDTGKPETQNLYKIKKELEMGRFQSNQSLKLYGGESETGRSINSAWIERGPYDVGGRTRALLFDPNDSTGKRVFAGGVSGGLWVNNDITNPDSEWTPIGDFLENTSISCLVSDPNNPQIFYAGTGESSTGDVIGSGIWKSTDAGQTWTQLLIPTTSYSFQGQVRNGVYYVNDIKVRNNNGQSEIYVGVSGAYADGVFNGVLDSGLYKSTDEGNTFTRLEGLFVQNFGPNPIHYPVQEIEIAADNSIWISTRSLPGLGIPTGGKILKSTDGGTTFEIKYDAQSENGSRVQIATSKTDPNKVYGLLQIVNENEEDEQVRIVKTVDGGETWISTSSSTDITLPNDADQGIPANDFTRRQAFYDLVIKVSPDNDDEVYTGGIDLFKSTDGAATWTQISKWSNNNDLALLSIPEVHADQHAIVFNPQNPNQLVFGNDGGIYFAPDRTNIASDNGIGVRNARYNVTQFYDAKLDPVSTEADEFILAGAQDNGTQAFVQTPTQGTLFDTFTYTSGDGGRVGFDKEGNYAVNSYVYNSFYYYYFPTNQFKNLVSQTFRGYGNFINEMALDNVQDVFFSNLSNMFVLRVKGLANNTLEEDYFNIVTPAQGEGISAMIVSPYTTTSSTLFVGTTIGTFYKITMADTNQVVETITTPVVGNISSISFGESEDHIILTVSNYGQNINKIFYTTDGGVTWDSKHGDLPDMPVRASFMNPEDSNEVVLGTELGIWQTTNFLSANPTWTKSPGDIGTVKVMSLDYRPSTRTLLAATYGRGVYTTKSSNLSTNDVSVKRDLFQVYPNPSRGTFKLNLASKYKEVDVKIYDASGKLVYQQEGVKEKEDIRTNLTTGVYVLEAKNNGQSVFTSQVMIK